MLITIAIAAVVIGVIVCVVGLVGVGSNLQPFVLGGGGVLLLVGVVCFLMLRFGSNAFFEIRDLSRLALGRVAHEQYRFDDARYYYHLVPGDSERLPEALYESATSRYESKDYAGARQWYEKVIAATNAPTAARAQFPLGETYFAQGKHDEAVKALLAVADVYAYPEWAARATFARSRPTASTAIASWRFISATASSTLIASRVIESGRRCSVSRWERSGVTAG
jgi:tetratricopeptide (TPR) repeat protein